MNQHRDEYTNEESWLLDEKYHGTPTTEFERDRARLRAGEPLAYVIGFVHFLGTVIHLDSRPLIPRAETEFWVKQVIDVLRDNDRPLRILDLCAGSGCIGVALLQAREASTVDFIEMDTVHHDTILRNVRENGIDTTRTHIYGGNLFENIGEKTYDLILSNPPYINPDTVGRVEESVLAYEPHLALFGGAQGLDVVRRIIEEAPAHLTSGGSLYVEHEPEQADTVVHLAHGAWRSATQHRDQYGLIRVTHLTK